MRAEIPSITVLGVRVARLTVDEALAEVARLYDGGGPSVVAFANAHTLNTAVDDPGFARILADVDLLLNDGSGLALAARMQGQAFPANLNGTDLTPRVLDLIAARGGRTYLLGGRDGVAEQARRSLADALPALPVVGAGSGFIDDADLADVIAEIRGTGTNALLVGMGNPLQERWLTEHLASTGARLGLAVGAFVDRQAGVVPRSPAWMRRLGIEWLYRLRLEPKRLAYRYLIGNPRFVWRAWRLRPH